MYDIRGGASKKIVDFNVGYQFILLFSGIFDVGVY